MLQLFASFYFNFKEKFMSTTQSKKSVALIGNQMNVSKEWLDQVKILETGTTEQKIALAGSDDLCDSIQIALACDEVLEVRLALSENPKLTELAGKILAGQRLSNELKQITDEELLRILYVQDDKFVGRAVIAKNGDIPESVKLDIIDWECDGGIILWLLNNGDNLKKMSKAVQLRLIRQMSLVEQQIKGIKGGQYGNNYWNFAQELSVSFWRMDFVNMDKETQVAFAKAFVQLYQDIQQSDECKNDRYKTGYDNPTVTLLQFANWTAGKLKSHPNFNTTAKVILSQIA